MLIRILRALCVSAGAVFTVTLCLNWALMTGGAFINVSSSLPRGVYTVATSQEIKEGSLVLACLEKDQAREAFERGYVTRGQCPGHYAPIGKHVVALKGDHVQVSAVGVHVNGQLLPLSIPSPVDGRGLPLPALNLNATLRAGEYLLLNPALDSFDSRYLGIIRHRQILAVLRPEPSVALPA